MAYVDRSRQRHGGVDFRPVYWSRVALLRSTWRWPCSFHFSFIMTTSTRTRWVVSARVAGGSTLSVRRRDYVDSARVLGATHVRLLQHHILPSIRTPLLVLASVQFGLVILSEAALSFLGLGVPPTQPSWGQTIAGGQDYLASAWWIATLPGIVLAA